MRLIDWLLGFATDRQVVATFLSSAIGFGGVILTLIFQHNSNLAARRDQEFTEKARLIRALKTDLGFLKKYSAGRALEFEGPQYGAFRSMTFPDTSPLTMADALLPKFDLLSENQIGAVLECYLYAKSLPLRLALVASDSEREHTPAGYVTVDVAASPNVAGIFRALEKQAENAVEALSDGA